MEKDIKHHYDNLIIGFGKGGKTLAVWLAKRGEEVAIIEKSDKMYGGVVIPSCQKRILMLPKRFIRF